MNRWAAKRDSNEQAIVKAFRAFGWSVEHLSGTGTPDLVVGKHHTLLLVEVKRPKAKLRPAQVKWHAAWCGPAPLIVRSVEDVQAINDAQCGERER